MTEKKPGPGDDDALLSTPRDYDVDEPLQVLSDPVAQWLDWEEQANLVGFRTSTSPVDVGVAAVPRAECEIHLLPGASPELVGQFLRGDVVLFPRHPLNRDPTVAWFDAPVSETWTARFTSSRTLALPGPESGKSLFSLKLATDHPHPDFHQPEKTRLREEAIGAVDWVRHIARVDRLLEPLADVALVSEVIVVLAAGRESGFMVRDLSLFEDGHYYLPALSLPFVGRQIARRHGAAAEAFWGRWFAESAGRAKARLFARYGLWYETPNPQNLLVQLRPDLHPTGTLVFRDVGDGECSTNAFECVDVPWTRLESDLRPETRNSFWAFDEAGAHSFDRATVDDWVRRHDEAYFAELAGWFPSLAPAASDSSDSALAHWNETLRRPDVEATLRECFGRRRPG